jgi:hypothetical protein
MSASLRSRSAARFDSAFAFALTFSNRSYGMRWSSVSTAAAGVVSVPSAGSVWSDMMPPTRMTLRGARGAYSDGATGGLAGGGVLPLFICDSDA